MIQYNPNFKCQLANTYDENKKYNNDQWFISPKLDGVRALWFSNEPDQLFSRTMKQLMGFEEIICQLKSLSVELEVSFFDGELYIENHNFNEIQSIVTTKNVYTYQFSKKNKCIFNCFYTDSKSYPGIRDRKYSKVFFISQQIIMNNKEDIYRELNIYTSKILGYEGIMLRSKKTPYSFGRSDNLLKVKKFKEQDCIIVEHFEGKGKHERRLGGFIVKQENGKICKVGTGFSDSQREEYFILNQVGKKASVKYQELSSYGIMRFPVFIGIKEDR